MLNLVGLDLVDESLATGKFSDAVGNGCKENDDSGDFNCGGQGHCKEVEEEYAEDCFEDCQLSSK